MRDPDSTLLLLYQKRATAYAKPLKYGGHGFLLKVISSIFTVPQLRTDLDKDPKHSVNKSEQKGKRKSEIPPHTSPFSLG